MTLSQARRRGLVKYFELDRCKLVAEGGGNNFKGTFSKTLLPIMTSQGCKPHNPTQCKYINRERAIIISIF